MIKRLGLLFATLLAVASPASATILFNSSSTALTAGDPTQTDRMFRDAVASTWASPKTFPGVFGTGSNHYHIYSIPVINTPFIQITFDQPSITLFASAYLDSYDPFNKSLNYLGDEGLSDPSVVFQVMVPTGHNLIVLLNETSANAGVGLATSLKVEGFIDSNFTDPSVPEPATWAMALFGLAGAGFFARRRRASR